MRAVEHHKNVCCAERCATWAPLPRAVHSNVDEARNKRATGTYEHLSLQNSPNSWAHTAEAEFAASQLGLPQPLASLPRNEITRRYGQHATAIQWAADCTRKYNAIALNKPLPPLSRSVDTISYGGPAVTSIAALAQGFNIDALPANARPLPGNIAPGLGALIAQGSDPNLPREYRVALFYLLEGRRGFFTDYAADSLENTLPAVAPAAPRPPPKCSRCHLTGHNRGSCVSILVASRCTTCRLTGHDAASCTNGPPPVNPTAAYYAAWGRLVNGSSQCPLCACNEPLGPAHLLIRCSNPAIAARRAAIISELPHFIGNLTTRLSRTRTWTPRSDSGALPPPSDSDYWPHEADAASHATRSIADWSSGHGAWVLFHALTATPWSTVSLSDSPPAVWDGAARVIAAEFDRSCVPAHRWRGLTNWWLRWAGSRSHDLLSLWQSEVNALDARNRLLAPRVAP